MTGCCVDCSESLLSLSKYLHVTHLALQWTGCALRAFELWPFVPSRPTTVQQNQENPRFCPQRHLCSVGRSAHRRYVPIVMCALAPGKLPVAPVLSYAETKHLRWAWYSSIHYIFKQFPWITYLVHSVKKNKQPTLFLGPVMRWAIWDKHKNLDMESYNLWAKINKYAT